MSKHTAWNARLRLGERIGSGSMAEVYRADLLGTDGFSTPVAVKRILPAHAADERAVARLAEEARILSRLRHPNIVSVLALERDPDGSLCLVMELIEGASLRELAEGALLPIPVVLYAVTELVRGLGYVHERQGPGGAPLRLVHRDVSPRNVLVSSTGAVKLADFGLARREAAGAPGASRIEGTLPYLSPEQAQGWPLDGRSDLFAAGVILYELLTGTRPFPGQSQATCLAALLAGRFEPPRALRPDIPADLDAIVVRLLQRAPADRFPDARAVLDALLPCQATSPAARDDLIALMRARTPEAPARPEPGPLRKPVRNTVSEPLPAPIPAGAPHPRGARTNKRPGRLAAALLAGSLLAMGAWWIWTTLPHDSAAPGPTTRPGHAVCLPPAPEPAPLPPAPTEPRAPRPAIRAGAARDRAEARARAPSLPRRNTHAADFFRTQETHP